MSTERCLFETHELNGNEPEDLEHFRTRGKKNLEKWEAFCCIQCAVRIERHYYRNRTTYCCKACTAKQNQVKAANAVRLFTDDEDRKRRRKEYMDNYNAKNAERRKKLLREHYQNNKEAYSARSRKNYINNVEKYLARKKKWQRENSERIARQNRIKRATDPSYRILGALRTRLVNALKGFSKSCRTIELLGCSIENLKRHLEKQFTPGMSWDNYGKGGWHIDHKIPCKAFDLTDPEQQKRCFHYTNLQPLWAVDNIRKSAKILPEYQMAA